MALEKMKTYLIDWKLFFCVAVLAQGSLVYGVDLSTSNEAPRYQARELGMNQFFSTLFSLDLQSLNNTNNSSTSAFGFSMTGIYAISRKWAASARVNQSFSTSGGVALYTGWRIAGEYALTGSFLRQKTQTRLGDWSVVESQETPPTGWKFSAGFNQLAFSGSGGSISFFGFDLALRKEFTAFGNFHPFVGGEIGQSSNGSQAVSKLQLTGGVLLWW